MNAIRALLTACFLLVSTPAAADTVATYKAQQGGQMTIEVSSNGNMRTSMGTSGTYSLTVDGEDYLVFYTDKGAVVARWADLGTVMRDHMKKVMPDMLDMPDSADPSPFKYIPGGQMTVGGRAGQVWYQQFGDALERAPKFVMSVDPDLAELGRAFVRQAESSMKLASIAFGDRNPMDGMLDVLKTGAPLLINGMALGAVSHAPIAAERFALPAKPETLEQVRERFEANGGHLP